MGALSKMLFLLRVNIGKRVSDFGTQGCEDGGQMGAVGTSVQKSGTIIAGHHNCHGGHRETQCGTLEINGMTV